MPPPRRRRRARRAIRRPRAPFRRKHHEKAGIDRMANPPIGARDDQLMTALQLDVAAPVGAMVTRAQTQKARPAKPSTAPIAGGQMARGTNRPWSAGTGHGQGRRHRKQIGGYEQRPDMRKARGGALGLGWPLRPARHGDPDGGPTGPHHHEKRSKEPAVEH